MKLRLVRADPAGNITLFVLDPVEKPERAGVAARLMERSELRAEQVGFACEPERGVDGCMEMAGGEFCGNASRAYGMLTARRRGVTGFSRLTLRVSGSERTLKVDVDMARGTARSEMPLPRLALARTVSGLEGTVVDLGGIVHFVTHTRPDETVMERLSPLFGAPRETGGFAGAGAYGVIFLHDGRLTPLVRVPAANTQVWEGSCGSGSLAAAVAESLGAADGAFARDYVQPAGTIRAELARRDGRLIAASIGGSVTLGEEITVEL